MGRGFLLTDEMIEEICEHLREGLYKQTACQLVGLDKRLFYKWWRRGKTARESISKGDDESLRDSDRTCAKLVEECEKATAVAIAKSVKVIKEHGDPKTHLAFLKATSKLYNPQFVVDEDTGEAEERDPMAIMMERLAALKDE